MNIFPLVNTNISPLVTMSVMSCIKPNLLWLHNFYGHKKWKEMSFCSLTATLSSHNVQPIQSFVREIMTETITEYNGALQLPNQQIFLIFIIMTLCSLSRTQMQKAYLTKTDISLKIPCFKMKLIFRFMKSAVRWDGWRTADFQYSSEQGNVNMNNFQYLYFQL